MEINVNLASGSEHTHEGHMQNCQPPFTNTGMSWILYQGIVSAFVSYENEA